MIAIALGAVVAILSSWWILSYLREGDAARATSRVTGGIGSVVGAVFLGGVAIVATLAGEFASALSLFGEVLGAYAPYVAHGVSIVVGYLSLGGRIEITPETWIFAMLAVLALLVMFDRGSR